MEVRLCGDGRDRELLDDFCRKVFVPVEGLISSGKKPAVKRDRRNPYLTGERPTAIAVHDGIVVGHVASTPFYLWVNGEERLAYWLGGIYVLEDYRGMGIAKKLGTCITTELPIVCGVARIEAALRTWKANGWIWPGMIADYVHLVKPKIFFSKMTGERVERFVPPKMKSSADLALKILKLPMSAAVKGWQSSKRIRSKAGKAKQLNVREVEEFGSEVDMLWENEKTNFGLTDLRNSSYINWQFPTEKGWRKIVFPGASGIKAWAIYTIMEYKDGGPLDGLRSLNVVDVFWSSREPGLLEDIAFFFLSRAYDEGVDIAMFSGDRPELNRVLKKSAFIKIPPTIHIGFHSHKKEDDWVQSFANSYITRGFADAAGGLGPS